MRLVLLATRAKLLFSSHVSIPASATAKIFSSNALFVTSYTNLSKCDVGSL